MPGRSPLARATTGALAAGLVVSAGACSSRFGAPDPATAQAEPVLRLWRILMVVALILGSLVAGLIAWALVRYRKRSGGEPSTNSKNVPLEILYTAVPFAIVAVLFGLTMAAQRDVNRLGPDPDLRIEVTGFQWGWRFHYLTEGITVIGTSTDEPTLVLPVRATARLTLMSPDVIHSFFVPNFLEKRDLVPGIENRIDLTPTRTGRFSGVCAEFCGLDHTRMTFAVEVVEPEQFQAFLARERDAGTAPERGEQGGRDEPGRQAAPGRREVTVG